MFTLVRLVNSTVGFVYILCGCVDAPVPLPALLAMSLLSQISELEVDE